ncbi:DUF1129 family protein [Lactobacillus psittaci]|uniref:Integral membrane protein n=1 Tax=Lactobacillus psittaci DSM 15354 TaxID=1122152 RepID=A0A0R1S484_9LACO|nr:DUF1129 family protein [Lactobacillus psittaci]KRL63342.1 hypothetical protein FC23_GL000912 [Lactobacillus psittaci DSM 15354]
MDTKEKNLKNSAKQAENLQKEEKLANLTSESPAKLRQNLSNKNSDYIFRLEKALIQGGKTEQEAQTETDKLLVEIISAQKQGVPASTLYQKSPVLKADEILHPVVKPKEPEFWQKAVDNGLLYFAIFAGMVAIMGLSSPKTQNSQLGIFTLIGISVVFGYVMTALNEEVIQSRLRDRKLGWGKMIFMLIGTVALIFVVISIFTLKAVQPINPVLPVAVNLILAILAFGGRYFFRKHYHITSSVLYPQGTNNK